MAYLQVMHRRSSRVAAALFIVGALALAPRAAGAQEPPVEILQINAERGRIHAVLTGAGSAAPYRDVLVCADQVPGTNPGEKACTLFEPTADTADYRLRATHTITAPAEVAALQWGDLGGDGREEVFYLTRSGVFSYANGLDSPATPVITRPILAPPGTTHVRRGRFLVDVTNDGNVDLLLPVPEGLALHAQSTEGTFNAEPTAMLAFPVIVRESSGGGPRRDLGGSRHQLGDANGDGLTDVFVLDPFGSYRFIQHADGSFVREQIAAPLHQENGTTSYIDMYGDWNADNHPDVAFTRFEQGRLMNTTLDIHLADASGTIDAKPSTHMAEAGNVVFPIFLDATGDGKSELLLYRLQFGIRFALNYFLRNRVLVDASVFQLNGDGTYAADPVVRTSLSLDVVEDGGEPARAAADVNGDGAMDMVVGLGEKRLVVYLGNPDTVMDTRPSWDIAVQAFGIAARADLNNDGRDDILIRYPQKNSESLVNIVLSRPS